MPLNQTIQDPLESKRERERERRKAELKWIGELGDLVKRRLLDIEKDIETERERQKKRE
jgi:hypothetical protein